jgi:hypothetical protein
VHVTFVKETSARRSAETNALSRRPRSKKKKRGADEKDHAGDISVKKRKRKTKKKNIESESHHHHRPIVSDARALMRSCQTWQGQRKP